jgi:Helicase associated domain
LTGNVPQKYEENRELGIWVNKQRMEKKALEENKKSSMTERKIQVLERIGFEWAKRKGQAAWDEKFLELLEYKSVHGNCEFHIYGSGYVQLSASVSASLRVGLPSAGDVPTKCRDNQALGRWVSTQRSNYKEFMEGTDTSKQMTEERIARLESVGFKWRMMSN